MSISYEHFKLVLPDPIARHQVGLALNDDEAQYLSQHESQAVTYYAAWTAPPAYSGKAVGGFVLSLVAVAIVGFLGVVALVVGILGIVLSGLAIGETRDGWQRGRGLAIAGLVISILTVVLYLVFVLILLVVLAASSRA